MSFISAMASSYNGFGPLPSQSQSVVPVIDPDNPMNVYYMNQAELHARRNPNDQFAQALWRHWVTTLQQFEAQRRALAAAVPNSPLTSGGQQGATAPSPVPSNLAGASPAPTPPGTVPVVTPGFGMPPGPQAHHGSLEQRFNVHNSNSTPLQSAPHSRQRSANPPPRGGRGGDRDSGRDRHRSRTRLTQRQAKRRTS